MALDMIALKYKDLCKSVTEIDLACKQICSMMQCIAKKVASVINCDCGKKKIWSTEEMLVHISI
jgi:hypothetical protein